MIRKMIHGIPFGVFDVLYKELGDDHRKHYGDGHTCSAACDPPAEAELVAFYKSLDEHQRELLRFIGMLHAHGYGMPIEMWQGPLPLELVETGEARH